MTKIDHAVIFISNFILIAELLFQYYKYNLNIFYFDFLIVHNNIFQAIINLFCFVIISVMTQQRITSSSNNNF